MKTLLKASLILLAGFISTVFSMDANGWASTGEIICAFENRIGGDPRIFNRPNYVKPLINNLGNIYNSNWFVNASIAKSFSLEAGIPIALIPIGNDDKSFNENGVQVPTIFGTHGDTNQDSLVRLMDNTVYGNEDLNGLGVLTIPYAQLGASFYHARAVFRFMMLPSISELNSFKLFGFGLQYSFGYLFQDKLPSVAQNLDVSLGFGYTTNSIRYQPKDYKGTLNLNNTAFTINLITGYKLFRFIEIMMSLGYQYANMESSGHLMSESFIANGQPLPSGSEIINPNISVKGNNGFKFGLEIAFQLGTSFHPVVGFDYAGKSSFTTNVLYFKQQFGEDKESSSNK